MTEPRDPELVADDDLTPDETEPITDGLVSPKNDPVPDEGAPE